MKKIIKLLLATALFLSTLTGCMKVSENNGDNTAAQTNESTATTTSSSNTDPASEQANSASDFRYEKTNEGTITIFAYLGSDKDVVIPTSIDECPVTRIELAAFHLDKNVTSVVMPDSVTYIGKDAFAKCAALETVVCSSNLTTISAFAFEDCISLSNIELPQSLTHIGYRAFANCTSLKHITIPRNSLNENSGECFVDSGLESVELQEGVSVIPASAFLRTHIEEIVLPSTVKSIQGSAFADCNIKSITLNEGLETIDSSALGGNPYTEIVIPSTVTSCSEYAFVDCENLVAVKFEGNAPNDFLCESDLINQIFSKYPVNFIIYYHQNAQGFTSPTWNGYETAVW